MADLRVNIGKLAMKNPVMTASGTFGYGLEFQDFVPLDEIGGKIIKVVPRDASVQVAENQGKTVVEALPESEMAGVYMDLACKILAECDMELPPGQQESA